jgi:hypothetical protein
MQYSQNENNSEGSLSLRTYKVLGASNCRLIFID